MTKACSRAWESIIWFSKDPRSTVFLYQLRPSALTSAHHNMSKPSGLCVSETSAYVPLEDTSCLILLPSSIRWSPRWYPTTHVPHERHLTFL